MSDASALPDLTSFPIVKPGKPTSIRRSHSVASLPTPPSTIRKRPRSHASSAFSSEDEDAAASADDVFGDSRASPQPQPRKKRRVDDGTVPSDTAAEDEFWGPTRPKIDSPKPVTEPDESCEHVEKREPSLTASASRAAAAATLLSPPPTRQRPPITPPRRVSKAKEEKVRPVRDSPNNPFLESPGDVSAPPSPVEPKTPLAEPPTLTYVFRGKKQIFVNPNYKAPPDPRVNLPETHPDYSPGERCEPRRLFVKQRLRHGAAVRSKHVTPRRARSPTLDPWSSDDESKGEPLPQVSLANKFASAAEDKDSELVPSTAQPAEAGPSRQDGSEPVAVLGKVVAETSNKSKVAPRQTMRDKYGQPKLVLAPTRADSRTASASPSHPEEDGSEGDDEGGDDATSALDEDPWALSAF